MKTKEEIQQWLQKKIAAEVRTTPALIPINRPFTDFGLDSIVMVTLVTDLEDWLGLSLDPTLFWEFPSIEVLRVPLWPRIVTRKSLPSLTNWISRAKQIPI